MDSWHTSKFIRNQSGSGAGPSSRSGLDSGVKLRPFKKDLDVIGDAFRDRWLKYYVPRPDKSVLWLGSVALYAPPLLST